MREHRGRAGNEQWKLELLGVAVHSFARLRLRDGSEGLKVEGRRSKVEKLLLVSVHRRARTLVEGRSKEGRRSFLLLIILLFPFPLARTQRPRVKTH